MRMRGEGGGVGNGPRGPEVGDGYIRVRRRMRAGAGSGRSGAWGRSGPGRAGLGLAPAPAPLGPVGAGTAGLRACRPGRRAEVSLSERGGLRLGCATAAVAGSRWRSFPAVPSCAWFEPDVCGADTGRAAAREGRFSAERVPVRAGGLCGVHTGRSVTRVSSAAGVASRVRRSWGSRKRSLDQ